MPRNLPGIEGIQVTCEEAVSPRVVTPLTCLIIASNRGAIAKGSSPQVSVRLVQYQDLPADSQVFSHVFAAWTSIVDWR